MTAHLAQQTEECGTFDFGCQAGAAFAGIVADVARGSADLVVTTAAWWAEADSVDPP